MNITLKRVFAVYVFVYTFFFASRPLSDPDFWWHLKTGQLIFDSHSIPRVDPFSFTNHGKAWVAHEWLSEVFFYAVYSKFGFAALIFIFAILTALAFWIVFRRCEAHPYVLALIAFVAVWSVLPTIGVRPRVFTLLFASIFLTVLAPDSVKRLGWKIFWLVPLMTLWANLHAGYIIGLVFIALSLAGVVVDSGFSSARLKSARPQITKLGLLFVACLGAATINPQGPKILLFPFEFFFSPVQQNEIVDWLSPNFHQTETLPLLILIWGSIAALAMSPKRPRPSELLFFLTTLYATLKSSRHVAIFALVAAPLFAHYLQHWIDASSEKRSFESPATSKFDRRAVVFGVLLLIPLVPLTQRLLTVTYAPPTQELTRVPIGAVDFMKSNQLTGNTFTDPNVWGGYLIWAMPSNPVYIDGRIDMYGDKFVSDYVSLIRGRLPWQTAFDSSGVRHAVLSTNSQLRLELRNSNEWREVYSDNLAVVFTRR